MSIGKISPSSPAATSFPRSFNSPSSERQQDLLNDVGAMSSAGSHGAETIRIVAVALKAHEKMRMEPFAYTLNHLVEQQNSKVVVICCLSRVRNEMGIDLIIDVETFRGITKKKLEAEINTQTTNLNHFLREFREKLGQRGVQLDIRIFLGQKSEDILVREGKAVHPDWVVLDVSFSGRQKKIQEAMECNVMLMKKKDSKPLCLPYTPKHSGQISDQAFDKYVDQGLDTSSPCPRTSGSNGITPTTRFCVEIQQTTNTATSNSNSETQSSGSAPPAPSPTQVATQGLQAVASHPAPQLSSPTAPLNPISLSTPTTPTLSGSGTSASEANQSASTGGPPTPPALSPTRVATEGLEASMCPSAAQLSSPTAPSFPLNPPNPGQENSSTSTGVPLGESIPSSTLFQAENGPQPPPALSPIEVATPGLLQLMGPPAAQLSSPTAPPIPPTPTSQSKPSTPASSGSGTLMSQENRSVAGGVPPSEPIPISTHWQTWSGPLTPWPVSMANRVATQGLEEFRRFQAGDFSSPTLQLTPSNPTSELKPRAPTSSGLETCASQANQSNAGGVPLSEPIPFSPLLETDSRTHTPPAVSPTHPLNPTSQSKTPASSSFGTLRGQEDPSVSHSPSQPFAFDTHLQTESAPQTPLVLSPSPLAAQGLQALMSHPIPQLLSPVAPLNPTSLPTPASSGSGILTGQANQSASRGVPPSKTVSFCTPLQTESKSLTPLALSPPRVPPFTVPPSLPNPTRQSSPSIPTWSNSGTLISQADQSASDGVPPSDPIPFSTLWQTESGPAAMSLQSPSRIPTQGLQALMHPPSPPSSDSTSPPNARSQLKATSPTSSGSGTWTGQANGSTSRGVPPSEPIPLPAFLETESGPPAIPALSTTQASPQRRRASIRPRALIRPRPLTLQLSSPTTPSDQQNRIGQPKLTTPASSGSGRSTGQTNQSFPLTQSDAIPYETALAMALSESLISASEEGIPVSQLSQQSSTWDGVHINRGLSDRQIPDEAALAMAINASLRSASEEGIPLSPSAQNFSSLDGNQGNRGPSNRSTTDQAGFRSWVEAPKNNCGDFRRGVHGGARKSWFGSRLGHADTRSTLEALNFGRTNPTHYPTSGIASSSSQSTGVASPSAPPASDCLIHYPHVDSSPVQVNYASAAGSNDGPPAIPKADGRSEHCVICWDAAPNTVCIPCGHLVGCIDCLKEIKFKNMGCPVCRTSIQQVIKVYAL